VRTLARALFLGLADPWVASAGIVEIGNAERSTSGSKRWSTGEVGVPFRAQQLRKSRLGYENVDDFVAAEARGFNKYLQISAGLA
jgi:hypothetical protein